MVSSYVLKEQRIFTSRFIGINAEEFFNETKDEYIDTKERKGFFVLIVEYRPHRYAFIDVSSQQFTKK